MSSAFGCIISSAITLLIFFPRNSENEYEFSSLGRLNRLETLQRDVGEKYTLDSYHEHNHLAFPSQTSIGSSLNPRVQLTYPINLASKSRGDDGTPEVFTPLPSVVSGAVLRPNRLCPDGNVEFGGMQDPPATETWVRNWASQFRSPLDVMQRLVY